MSESGWCCFCQRSSDNPHVKFIVVSNKNGSHGICDDCLRISINIGLKKEGSDWLFRPEKKTS